MHTTLLALLLALPHPVSVSGRLPAVRDHIGRVLFSRAWTEMKDVGTSSIRDVSSGILIVARVQDEPVFRNWPVRSFPNGSVNRDGLVSNSDDAISTYCIDCTGPKVTSGLRIDPNAFRDPVTDRKDRPGPLGAAIRTVPRSASSRTFEGRLAVEAGSRKLIFSHDDLLGVVVARSAESGSNPVRVSSF